MRIPAFLLLEIYSSDDDAPSPVAMTVPDVLLYNEDTQVFLP